ncbi:MAG: hypothetical protein M5U26_10095 [Planctomycetota bacterium]|nr:hypothetical protein [Planctomycetota bacterium]
MIGIRELASWAHRKRYAGAGVLPQSWTLPDEAAPHAASYAKWHEGLTRFSYWTWIAGAVLRSGKGSLGSYLVMAGLALYAAKMLHDYVRLGLWEDLLLFVGFGGGLLYLYLRVATFPQLLLFLGAGARPFSSPACACTCAGGGWRTPSWRARTKRSPRGSQA